MPPSLPLYAFHCVFHCEFSKYYLTLRIFYKENATILASLCIPLCIPLMYHAINQSLNTIIIHIVNGHYNMHMQYIHKDWHLNPLT